MKNEMQRLNQIGKKAIADRGYRSQANTEEYNIFLFLDLMDAKDLHAFKTKACLRHEIFNGWLKMYGILQKRFKISFEIHIFAFEAIVVTVQYQMDNGSPNFAV
eukprot:6245549-Ditylum_brightwellii.AAC.1